MEPRKQAYSLTVRRSALALFEKGFGYKSVARQISVPQSTVRTWQQNWKAGCFRTRENRRVSRYPECLQVWALTAHARGRSLYQIALELKVPKGTVRKWVLRHSLSDFLER